MTERELQAQVRAATAPLAAWVETLAERLEKRFKCEVRGATAEELQRPAHDDHIYAATAVGGSFAVQPNSPAAATPVVVRHDFFTGAGVTLKFGEVGAEVVPCCDECAVLPPSRTPGDDLVEQGEAAVWAATRGFAEFRRENDRATEPEMAFEEGWFYSGMDRRGHQLAPAPRSSTSGDPGSDGVSGGPDQRRPRVGPILDRDRAVRPGPSAGRGVA